MSGEECKSLFFAVAWRGCGSSWLSLAAVLFSGGWGVAVLGGGRKQRQSSGGFLEQWSLAVACSSGERQLLSDADPSGGMHRWGGAAVFAWLAVAC